jgi:hypothetical protein
MLGSPPREAGPHTAPETRRVEVSVDDAHGTGVGRALDQHPLAPFFFMKGASFFSNANLPEHPLYGMIRSERVKRERVA